MKTRQREENSEFPTVEKQRETRLHSFYRRMQFRLHKTSKHVESHDCQCPDLMLNVSLKVLTSL